MPISHTKNMQTEETLQKMTEKAFDGCQAVGIEELKEGYFNAAYLITLEDGRETIVKIAPPGEADIMSYEKNIMRAEVSAMKLVRTKTDLPVAEVFYYDDSHTLCKAEYFFMEKLPGESLDVKGHSLSEEEKNEFSSRTGRLTKKINSIAGEKFGLLGQPDRMGDNWYEVFYDMMTMAANDAVRKDIDVGIELSRLFDGLKRDKSCFEEVKIPRLVQWDLWAGNILIEENRITGLIDFERCLWGDPLLEVGFRTYWYKKAFYEGYGITELTDNQRVRALWYDVYLMLLMAQEYVYRKYESSEMSDMAKRYLRDWAEQKLEI